MVTHYDNTAPQTLWLSIYLPMLPVEVFTRGLKPEDTSRPIVILAQRKVRFLNPAAHARGINIGSSLDTAFTLSSQVVSFERNEQKEFSTPAPLTADWLELALQKARPKANRKPNAQHM